MSVKVRLASLTDLPQLSKLFDQYRQFYQQPDDLIAARKFLQTRMEKHQSVIFVAHCSETGLIGFVQLYPIFSSVRLSSSLLLNDLYVSPAARKSGVGRRLMGIAKDYAISQQACWLMLQTHLTNQPARALYESLGYRHDSECAYYYLQL